MYNLNWLFFDVTNHIIGPSMNGVIRLSNMVLSAAFPCTMRAVSLAAGRASALTFSECQLCRFSMKFLMKLDYCFVLLARSLTELTVLLS